MVLKPLEGAMVPLKVSYSHVSKAVNHASVLFQAKSPITLTCIFRPIDTRVIRIIRIRTFGGSGIQRLDMQEYAAFHFCP